MFEHFVVMCPITVWFKILPSSAKALECILELKDVWLEYILGTFCILVQSKIKAFVEWLK